MRLNHYLWSRGCEADHSEDRIPGHSNKSLCFRPKVQIPSFAGKINKPFLIIRITTMNSTKTSGFSCQFLIHVESIPAANHPKNDNDNLTIQLEDSKTEMEINLVFLLAPGIVEPAINLAKIEVNFERLTYTPGAVDQVICLPGAVDRCRVIYPSQWINKNLMLSASHFQITLSRPSTVHWNPPNHFDPLYRVILRYELKSAGIYPDQWMKTNIKPHPLQWISWDCDYPMHWMMRILLTRYSG